MIIVYENKLTYKEMVEHYPDLNIVNKFKEEEKNNKLDDNVQIKTIKFKRVKSFRYYPKAPGMLGKIQ